MELAQTVRKINKMTKINLSQPILLLGISSEKIVRGDANDLDTAQFIPVLWQHLLEIIDFVLWE